MFRSTLLQSKLLKHHGVSWSKGSCNSIRSFGSEREEKKEELVERLLKAKEDAGVTFDEIAKKLKVTNVYAAQLFVNQAQLKAKTAEKLANIVPGISEEDLKLMQKSPMRSFDPAIMQEPLIYRLVEAMQVYYTKLPPDTIHANLPPIVFLGNLCPISILLIKINDFLCER